MCIHGERIGGCAFRLSSNTRFRSPRRLQRGLPRGDTSRAPGARYCNIAKLSWRLRSNGNCLSIRSRRSLLALIEIACRGVRREGRSGGESQGLKGHVARTVRNRLSNVAICVSSRREYLVTITVVVGAAAARRETD